MIFVRIFDEIGERKVSIFEWADLCSVFFIACNVYLPYFHAKEFAKEGILNTGMSGYLEWDGFQINREDYFDILKFFQKQYSNLIFISDSVDLIFESDEDLSIWRQEIAFGIPYDEHKSMLEKCHALEKSFRFFLDRGEDKKSYEIYGELMDAHLELQDFVMKYRGN